jgi:hypothetical protein
MALTLGSKSLLLGKPLWFWERAWANKMTNKKIQGSLPTPDKPLKSFDLTDSSRKFNTWSMLFQILRPHTVTTLRRRRRSRTTDKANL